MDSGSGQVAVYRDGVGYMSVAASGTIALTANHLLNLTVGCKSPRVYTGPATNEQSGTLNFD